MSHNIDPSLKNPHINPIRVPVSFRERCPKTAAALRITGIVLGIIAIVAATVLLVTGVSCGFPISVVLLGLGSAVLLGGAVSLVKKAVTSWKEHNRNNLISSKTWNYQGIQKCNPKLNLDVPNTWPLFDRVKDLLSNYKLSVDSHTSSILEEIYLDDKEVPPLQHLILENSSSSFSYKKHFVSGAERSENRDSLRELLLDEHTSLKEIVDDIVDNHKQCIELLEKRKDLLITEGHSSSLHVPGVEHRNLHLTQICSHIIDGLSAAGGVFSIKVPTLSPNMKKVWVAVTTVLMVSVVTAIVLAAIFASGGAFFIPVLASVAVSGGLLVVVFSYLTRYLLSKTKKNRRELIQGIKRSLDFNQLKAISDLQAQLLISLQYALEKEKATALKYKDVQRRMAVLKSSLARDFGDFGEIMQNIRARLAELRIREEDDVYSSDLLHTDETLKALSQKYSRLRNAVLVKEEEEKKLLKSNEANKMQEDLIELYGYFSDFLQYTKNVVSIAISMQNDLIKKVERNS
ncbi:hypothetical protein [Chlamydia pecorum]|uniref:hypothetical protein n=1 Tax=Chlamydia pecorum TaxID=85991 RepID=UPI00041EC5A3|nr:hypothetical protein [Chlamydia pecorum]